MAEPIYTLVWLLVIVVIAYLVFGVVKDLPLDPPVRGVILVLMVIVFILVIARQFGVL